MALTPNIMMAVEGLMANTALQVNPIVGQDTYEAQVIVADYRNTVIAYDASQTSGNISQTLVDDLITRLDNTAPYISNRAPGTPPTDENGAALDYTKVLDQHVLNLFPPGSPTNNQEFVQYALISMGAKDTANKYVNSAVNATSDLCAGTFTSQDALMTGSLSSINRNVNDWGEELYDSGSLFDFAKLDNLGTPQAIIESLMLVGMLGFISDELTLNGIDVVPLVKAIRDNPTQVLSPIVQKRCYEAFALVTGNKLRNILKAMHFVTPGIETMQDLLDLTKVFPATFKTLTAPRDGVLQDIYKSNGSIQAWVADLSSPIIAVIPTAQAKSNWAFIISLGQVRGILNSTPGQIGSAASTVQTNRGLLKTGSLTVPLPDATGDYIISSMGGGSGPDTTFYLSDFIGAPAAVPMNENYATLNTILPAVQTAGGFDDIALVLQIMREVLGGLTTPRVEFTFTSGGNPPPDDYQIKILAGNPGAGVWNSSIAYPYSLALAGLLPELDTAVANYIAAYPSEHNQMLKAQQSLVIGVSGAVIQLWDSNVRFELTHVVDDLGGPDEFWYQTGDPALNGLAAQKSSTLAFAENLGQYGKKIDKGNIVEILEAMVTDTLGGNAIVAAMREGRNQEQLDASGIRGDNQINDQPSVVEPGNIS